MNNVLKLQAAIFICAFAASCHKGQGDNPGTMPQTVIHDSITRLSKLIFFEYRVSTTDTIAYDEYMYDSLQRVTALNYYDYNNGAPVLTTVHTFYYNGNDSLAYKMIEVNPDPVNGYSETTFYFYDNLQRLIKDSVIYSARAFEVDEYNYTNSTITASFKGVSTTPGDAYTQTDTGFIGSTGDVIKTNSLINSSSSESYTNTFTFDDRPNPFYQLNIHTTYIPVAGYDFFLDGFYLQKHNTILDTAEDHAFPGVIESSTYSYTYNSSGLPAAVDVAYSFGQDDEVRIIFVYKKI